MHTYQYPGCASTHNPTPNFSYVNVNWNLEKLRDLFFNNNFLRSYDFVPKFEKKNENLLSICNSQQNNVILSQVDIKFEKLKCIGVSDFVLKCIKCFLPEN